jgi:predicted RNase H-like nuclease (RuvC/YqgF family)
MKSNLIKTFLVLNFMLIIGAMVFSMFFYFKDRELVKARTLITLEGVEKISQNLKWGGIVSWESDADRKTDTFNLTLPTTTDEVTNFEAQLNSLEEYATLRIEQLSQQYTTLLETQAELAQTEETLSIRTQELAAARREIGQLEETLAQTNRSLDEANDTIGDLEREKSTLERQVKDLESELAAKDMEISRLQEQVALRVTEYQKLEKLWKACIGRSDTTVQRGPEGEVPFMDAVILAIDPLWDFVVINRGEVDVLPMFSEAFVHRGETYVGKIRVTQVERGASIAEILDETFTEGMSLEVGDTVFIPTNN